jgi:hypothetical protein
MMEVIIGKDITRKEKVRSGSHNQNGHECHQSGYGPVNGYLWKFSLFNAF